MPAGETEEGRCGALHVWAVLLRGRKILLVAVSTSENAGRSWGMTLPEYLRFRLAVMCFLSACGWVRQGNPASFQRFFVSLAGCSPSAAEKENQKSVEK